MPLTGQSHHGEKPMFCSKILLFGEHTIANGSRGLSMPYRYLKGRLRQGGAVSEQSRQSNAALRPFAAYLDALQRQEPGLVQFDIDALNRDLDVGLYFDSDIPQGYGVGSSGALVAAVYDAYAINKIEVSDHPAAADLLTLKKIFGAMESFFHGKSSGLEPLNSYTGRAILIHALDRVEIAGIPASSSEGKGGVFLLDSGASKKTAPMVKIFMDNLSQADFRDMVKNEFITYSDLCIRHFLGGDAGALLGDMKRLSAVVLKNFKQMIPEAFQTVWQQGIEHDDFYLKLCGSGGGGYLLGFAKDIERAKDALRGYKIETVYRF